MKLDGIHHITAITGNAQRNLDFYAGVLGLRFVKKTVNFDAPDVYHLYYGDELGNPGSIMTFFEFPGAAPGRPAAGMIYRVVWRVAGRQSLDLWAQRLDGHGVAAERGDAYLRFADPEGLEVELVPDDSGDPPLAASPPPDLPQEHALLGFDGVRAYGTDSADDERLLADVLDFTSKRDGFYRADGDSRHSAFIFDVPPGGRGVQGAGSVHHIAWAATAGDHATWRNKLVDAGAHVTEIIDRVYFKSIYFRIPSGVLFEIATVGPGFTVDEPAESLGESLKLPAQHEHLRAQLIDQLTPIVNPRREVVGG